MAVERMRTREDAGELAKELGVTRRCLYKWRAKPDLADTAEELARPHTREASYRKQVRRLERLLAEKTLEVDFFKVPCKKSRLDARRAVILARGHPRANPRREALAR